MTPPLIGITTYGRDETNRFSLPGAYVDAVRRAGGIALLLPPGEPDVERVLGALDGIVLAGGGDIDPTLYGGTLHETVYNLDHERDQAEIAVARLAVDTRKPILGICRGTQVLNVMLGGTLFEHLPDVVGDTINHRLPPREPTEHAIRIEAGSRLAALLSAVDIVAASWHHQAICKLGSGLEVVARAPDGTIEAVEMADHPWLMAVQWHPELTAASDPLQQRLFDTFIEQAILHRSSEREIHAVKG